MPDLFLLDNPAWHGLGGPHAHVAQTLGQARRYHPEVSFASAVAQPWDPTDVGWADLARLAGPGELVTISASEIKPPEDWTLVDGGRGVQMIDVALETAPDSEAVSLTQADVTEVLALIERTQPGPFLPRTLELGGYLGIRREGQLIAMAGERMHPPGWTEISAVCTDAAFRGQGLGARLVRAVAHRIKARGDHPLLHAAQTNTGAIRLYESLGFSPRIQTSFLILRTPGVRTEHEESTS